MTHMKCQTGDTRTFHLIIGDTLTLVTESGNLLIDIRHGHWDTQYTSLRTIESVRCDRITARHIIARNLIHQIRIRSHHIRHSGLLGIAHKINKSLLKLKV